MNGNFRKPSSEFTRIWKLPDGTPVTLRPIGPEDAKIEREFVHRLSKKSKYYRFLTGIEELTDEMVRRFTCIDYERDMALIATIRKDGKETEIAVGRFNLYKDETSCEFALVVEDAWQAHGIGYQILSDLIGIARSKGLKTMKGLVFAENRPMIELAKALGFRIQRVPEDATVVEAVKDLTAGEPSPPPAPCTVP